MLDGASRIGEVVAAAAADGQPAVGITDHGNMYGILDFYQACKKHEIRYFFYITNDRTTPASEIVFLANDRCDQENLIAQLKGGVKALAMPVDDLVSNWAYMVMASLAWTLKAWAALLLPEEPGHVEEHRVERRSWLRMEFATFRAAVIELPCQVVRGGGRLIFRLMSWNPWQGALLRLVERLRRTDANTIDYRVTVEDPLMYTQPWTVRLPLAKTEAGIYEYA